ncbi:hypothetical protein [Leptospira kirschneri]|uniref:hypothetical protein n=1 Tax=Leptospira kirschneri TaxID=29507 RepID=UPI0009E25B5D|nr:hypothetical protein [Leptospira kirschneri]
MYFLIEHNRTTKETQFTSYKNYSEARGASLWKEQQYFLNRRNEMEVVVFEAETLDALERTHSRYFAKPQTTDGTVETLVAVGLLGLALYLLSKK